MKILFWRILVVFFILLGVIGAILPGMPTTVFLILAAWAASKGWPQVDEWLMNHPKYGQSLRNWRATGSVARKVKWIACSMMLCSGIIMFFTSAPIWVKIFTDIIMFIVAIWLCLRPEPKDNIEIGMQYNQKEVDIFIDLKNQLLMLPKLGKKFSISTALNGIGEAENSGKTPRGWHVIAEKIGNDAQKNSVFVGRQPTGEVYSSEYAEKHPNRDWILTRILWLKGLESGFNLGEGVDTYNRYIYIHGTPDKNPMGIPLSHGCVRMHNDDLIELFNLVDENSLIYISENSEKTNNIV